MRCLCFLYAIPPGAALFTSKKYAGGGPSRNTNGLREGGVVIAVAYKDKAKKEEVDDDGQIKGKNNHKTPKREFNEDFFRH